MKRFRLLTGSVIAALLLTLSCAEDDSLGESGVKPMQKISIAGEISQIYQTRVNDAGFCDGDAVGIYIVDYDGANAGTLSSTGNRADNMKYTFDEKAYQWNPSYDIYWKDAKTHIDIYGYYPYGTPGDVAAYPFEVQKDQSTSAAYGKPCGYEASDFLWGKAENVSPTDKVIPLSFRHKMASVRITLVQGTGFEADEWSGLEKEASVLNTKRNAVVDLTTGEVTAVGETATTGTIPYKVADDFRAIVVPQDIAAGTTLISVTVGGTAYTLKKDAAFTYLPSKLHNFTITVNKRAITGGYEFVLTSESITAWENDAVSHDATAREYIVIDVETPGTLDSCIAAAGKEVAKVQNLKLTGKINSGDFYTMREKMELLEALNLKEVQIVDDGNGNGNAIPTNALSNKTSLLRLILPDKLTDIGYHAFWGCVNLTGSLLIPEGVTYIEDYAFSNCHSLTGTLSLPTTLERIESNAFRNCGFIGELKLPDKLKYIGGSAFSDCRGLYGDLRLPDGLKYLESNAFSNCSNLTGSLEIPAGLTEIPDYAFFGCGLNGNLILHDRITSIGQGAFNQTKLKGELKLPKELKVISNRAFGSCDFSGELKIPESVVVIGEDAFVDNWRLMGTLNIPKDVQAIGAGAFGGCSHIERVVFEDGIETIGTGAFADCFGIGGIVCKGVVPPYVQAGAFDGVPKDNFIVEVPEAAVAQYQVAPGWCDFKRISAYRNLVIRPNIATAINTSVTRDLVLNADEAWTVESQPDWVTLDQTSGTGKTALKLTFSEMAHGAAREGDIVFKLNDKDYRTRCHVTQYDYEYGEDQIVTLQTATQGKGVNLVFLGDGYSAKDISEGVYMKDIKEAVEHYFGIEPYKSYRNYFNVYTGIAVSPESGIGGVNTIIYNRFNTTAKGGASLGGGDGESDNARIFEYACQAPTVDESNIDETLIVMIPNTEDYGGICYMFDEGAAIAYCPKSDYGYPFDFRGVIQHEAGGHGFGKLGDEYIYHNAFIDNCMCFCCEHDDAIRRAQAKGWYDNLSLSGKMNEVTWSHLIFYDKYKQVVDIFEGGFMHSRGVYRSEQNSCMNNNIPYYSAISREAIVKRIKRIAGEEYRFDDFVANDVMDASTVETRSDMPRFFTKSATRQQAPVMMGKRPKLNVK